MILAVGCAYLKDEDYLVVISVSEAQNVGPGLGLVQYIYTWKMKERLKEWVSEWMGEEYLQCIHLSCRTLLRTQTEHVRWCGLHLTVQCSSLTESGFWYSFHIWFTLLPIPHTQIRIILCKLAPRVFGLTWIVYIFISVQLSEKGSIPLNIFPNFPWSNCRWGSLQNSHLHIRSFSHGIRR